jgi:hypothetical protein
MPVPAPEVLVGITQISDTTALVGPPLSVLRAGNNVVLSWPRAYVCFALEMTDRLAPSPVWVPVQVAPLVVGDANVVTLPLTQANKYYRLRK